MWLRYLLELGFKQTKPRSVNEDNTACILWATEITVVTRKNRHLHVNNHYVREQVQKKESEVKYINTYF